MGRHMTDFRPAATAEEPAATLAVVKALGLRPHIEGGYFLETDRDPRRIPNPYYKKPDEADVQGATSMTRTVRDAPAEDLTRNASTSIFYYLTPRAPMGAFHRNRSRTIHTLHRGRGTYVLIHADEPAAREGAARVETFVVGSNVAAGERLQWIVEGGKYKATFLLPDDAEDASGLSNGLLISETVVPGFEYQDHDFLEENRLRSLISAEEADELAWLLRKGPPPQEHEL